MSIHLTSKIKLISKYVWIFLAILCVGIFLRTYHFHDWLQFGPDQARDANLISDIINKKQSLPLLGPRSGNTQFYMGSYYYWMEYASARIFGNAPDKLAYPDLFFSILAIPMLFLFLMEYFKRNISLIMTFLMSISYFCIVNSRFATNPNSIPFFILLFLYSVLKLVSPEKKKPIFWAAMLGISLGVGIQLHTLLFVSMPIIAFLAFLYYLYFSLRNKNFNAKVTGGIILAALFFFSLMNAGQIVHEVQTNGSNIKHFIKSAKSQSSTNYFREFSLASACQLEANAQIVFPAEDREKCNLFDFKKNQELKTNVTHVLEISILILFSMAGYFLMIWNLRKEKNENKRNFLILILVYNLLSFLIILPVVTQVTVRYFIILFFIPFIFLGLGMEEILKMRWKTISKAAMILIILIPAFSNASTIKDAYAKYAGGNASSTSSSVLGEIEPIANFMIQNDNSSKIVYLAGMKKDIDRFAKPLAYIIQLSGVKLNVIRSSSEADIRPGTFYIVSNNKNNSDSNIDNHPILKHVKFNQVNIFILQ